MKVLLVTPPMSDLNTPYPATAYLTGHLRTQGIEVSQADWSIELACRLFSEEGLDRLGGCAREVKAEQTSTRLQHFLGEFSRYRETVEPVVAFLQGRNPGLAADIISRTLLPEGSLIRKHFEALGATSDTSKMFGELGSNEQARHLATLYLCELGRLVHKVDGGYHHVAYAKKVAQSSRFDKVLRYLGEHEEGLIARLIGELTEEGLGRFRPDVLGLTVPFAGNLVGALRIAETARRVAPNLKIVMGGGYANTCLRQLGDARFFDFVDFLTLDDGERPLACILEHLGGTRGPEQLLRTFVRENGKVVFRSSSNERDLTFSENSTPSYAGLPLRKYMATMSDFTRPAKILSKRWNKLTLAHGCYWKKCTFCDLSLDYISRYEPQRVDRLIDQIESIVDETGNTDFHWVDEAAPPALLRALSVRLIEKRIPIAWYGNIRFERTFTPDLARLMAQAGCVMVTAGLEVASDRLLDLIKKGVTVAQVARVAKAFADHGIYVHAYLMYGFLTETVQETVDSLEMVRQLFDAGCLHSGYWHRLEALEHSPIGMSPAQFGIRLRRRAVPDPDGVFTRYKIPFEDPTGVDHEALGPGLWNALRSYERGLGLDRPVHDWFSQQVPPTTVVPDFIARVLVMPIPLRPGLQAAP